MGRRIRAKRAIAVQTGWWDGDNRGVVVLPGTEGTLDDDGACVWSEALYCRGNHIGVCQSVPARPGLDPDDYEFVDDPVNLDDGPAMPKVGQRVRAKVCASGEWRGGTYLIPAGTEGVVRAANDTLIVRWDAIRASGGIYASDDGYLLRHTWSPLTFEILPDAEPSDAGPSRLTDAVQGAAVVATMTSGEVRDSGMRYVTDGYSSGPISVTIPEPEPRGGEPFRGETLTLQVNDIPVEVTVRAPKFRGGGDTRRPYIPIESRTPFGVKYEIRLCADGAEVYANAILAAVREAKRRQA